MNDFMFNKWVEHFFDYKIIQVVSFEKALQQKPVNCPASCVLDTSGSISDDDIALGFSQLVSSKNKV